MKFCLLSLIHLIFCVECKNADADLLSMKITPKDVPFLVRILVLQTDESWGKFAGSYVSPNWILAASECTRRLHKQPRHVETCMGFDTVFSCFNTANSRQVHLLVNSVGIDHEVTMMRIDKPFELGPEVALARLPRQVRAFSKRKCFSAGWYHEEGSTFSYAFASNVVVRRSCEASYLCAFTKAEELCKTEFGNPLICDEYLLGILTTNNTGTCNKKVCQEAIVRKISHGDIASLEDLPFMVRLQVKYGAGMSGLCAGSYVHPHWVMTATHCIAHLRSGVKVEVCMGVEEAARCNNPKNNRKVKEIFHPTNLQADVTMMRIEAPFVLGPKIQVGKLPEGSINLRNFTKEKCTAAGWGRTQSGKVASILRRAQVELMVGCFFPGYLCVYSETEGPCKGDSGSPLICQGLIIGVLSKGNTDKCGIKDVSVLYVKVDLYLNFIHDAIAGKLSASKLYPDANLLLILIIILLFLN